MKAAFLYDPRVMAFNPQVEISDREVTLVGTVDTYPKRGAAEDNAYEAGAWKVKNSLRARSGPEFLR